MRHRATSCTPGASWSPPAAASCSPSPRHRYTTGLLASVPRLDAPRGEPLRPIPGSAGDTIAWARGVRVLPALHVRHEACLDPALALTADPFAGPAAAGAAHLVRCVHPRASDETSDERAPVSA